jgi:hypothetical protein
MHGEAADTMPFHTTQVPPTPCENVDEHERSAGHIDADVLFYKCKVVSSMHVNTKDVV